MVRGGSISTFLFGHCVQITNENPNNSYLNLVSRLCGKSIEMVMQKNARYFTAEIEHQEKQKFIEQSFQDCWQLGCWFCMPSRK